MTHDNISITCPRCRGSGRHSFHRSRGTVCFSCDGTGTKMVDAARYAKALTRRAADQEKAASKRAMRDAIAVELHAEMDARFGPFPDDMNGSYRLMCAVKRATCMTIGDMVQARIGEMDHG